MRVRVRVRVRVSLSCCFSSTWSMRICLSLGMEQTTGIWTLYVVRPGTTSSTVTSAGSISDSHCSDGSDGSGAEPEPLPTGDARLSVAAGDADGDELRRVIIASSSTW